MNSLKGLCGPYGLAGMLLLCAGLLLYVRHLLALKTVSGRGSGDSGSEGLASDEVLDGYSALMGKAKPDTGVSSVSAEDFGFAVPGNGDQLGLLADVQQEIREMCQLLADRDGTKEDFFVLFAALREEYPRLAGHPLRASLEEFIREQVPFFLSVAELESLWD